VRYKFALDLWGLMPVPYSRMSAPRMYKVIAQFEYSMSASYLF
jgi:hypothetical protein